MSDSSIDKFVSITALGQLYGVSRVLIGKWLVECGLREEYIPTEGKPCLVPTSRAFHGGYVKEAMAPNERFVSFVASGSDHPRIEGSRARPARHESRTRVSG